MSVQSEINRISGNVTAALAAIAEKGVTVGNGSNSDDLATLIAAIEAGGGGISLPDIFKASDVITGTFTPTSDERMHDLYGFAGITPRILIIYTTDLVLPSSVYAFRFGIAINNLPDPYMSPASSVVVGAGEFAGGLLCYINASGAANARGRIIYSDVTSSYAKDQCTYAVNSETAMITKISKDGDNMRIVGTTFSTTSSSVAYFLAGVTYTYVVLYSNAEV